MYNRTFDTLDEHNIASYLWLDDEDDDAEWFEDEEEDEDDKSFSFESSHDISDADF